MTEPRRCDLLVASGWVVTVDPGDRVVEDGAVAVSDGRIVAVGPTAGLRRDWAAAREVDAAGGVVLPGLVNAHTHLAMTLYRGCADDVDLQGFLERVWRWERATVTEDAVRLGVTAGIAESLRCGVTAALDMYYHHAVALEVAASLGFRLVTGPAFFSFAGPDFPDFETRYAAAVSWADGWEAGPGLRPCLCPHSTYTLDRRQLRAVRELADRLDAVVHVHAAENRREVEQVSDQHGATPVEVLDSVGLLRAGTVLAHGVVLTDSDIARIAASGAAVAHCPASNLKLASGIAPVPELQQAGATVCLGTDGPASSNDLDMWTAMRLGALLHKGRLADPTMLPAPAVLRMATLDGARALGLDAEIGSLEVGKRADIVVMDSGSVPAAPVYDACSLAVYALGRADVRAVFLEGRQVVDAGRVTVVSERDVASALREFARGAAGRSGAGANEPEQ